MAAFYIVTVQLVSFLNSPPDASEWVAGQNLAALTTWTSSAIQTLKQLHNKLQTHYSCTEWAQPPIANANPNDAPAQETRRRQCSPSLPPSTKPSRFFACLAG
jgi:hypothetical protein